MMIYKDFKLSNIMMINNKYEAVVENSNEYLIVKANNLEDMKEEFHNCIDNYLKKCKELGKKPYITIK